MVEQNVQSPSLHIPKTRISIEEVNFQYAKALEQATVQTVPALNEPVMFSPVQETAIHPSIIQEENRGNRQLTRRDFFRGVRRTATGVALASVGAGLLLEGESLLSKTSEAYAKDSDIVWKWENNSIGAKI